ncbi:hypothetical protein PMIN03_012702 [Paraphaeosphaeria minitans]
MSKLKPNDIAGSRVVTTRWSSRRRLADAVVGRALKWQNLARFAGDATWGSPVQARNVCYSGGKGDAESLLPRKRFPTTAMERGLAAGLLAERAAAAEAGVPDATSDGLLLSP